MSEMTENTNETENSATTVVDAETATVEKPSVNVPVERFTEMALAESVQTAVAELGYDTPTPIQAEMIPHMLEGKDVIGQAQTGTGKTAAFALPILSRIDVNNRSPQVLVLAPTRELANQVADSFEKYGKGLAGFRVAAIYGGQSYDIQLRQLRRGVQVIVGTPGRTIDHIKRGTLDVKQVDCLVLDEADEMLNMGFLSDVEWILEQTRVDRQVALFSATMPAAIRGIAQNYLHDPVEILIKQEKNTVANIRQRCLIVNGRDKLDALIRIMQSESTDGVIVFARTRGATQQIAEALDSRGYSATALNGDMPQAQRERTVQRMKNGQLNILVATDVAARGLDIDRISHVFNFDLSHDSEAYVHRIGRTGRAGRSGDAILFLSHHERRKVQMFERITGKSIEMMRLPSIDVVNKMRIDDFKQKVVDQVEKQTDSFYKELAESLVTEDRSIESVAAALVELAQGVEPLRLVEKRQQRSQGDYGSRDSGSRDSGSRAGRSRDQNGGRGEYRDRGGRSSERSAGSNNRGTRDTGGAGPNKREDRGPDQGMKRYRVQVGRRDGVQPGNLVGAITNEAGIETRLIGRINIQEDHSTVDLPGGMSNEQFSSLQKAWVAGSQLNIALDQSAPGSEGSSSSYQGRSGSPSNARPAPYKSGAKRDVQQKSQTSRSYSKPASTPASVPVSTPRSEVAKPGKVSDPKPVQALNKGTNADKRPTTSASSENESKPNHAANFVKKPVAKKLEATKPDAAKHEAKKPLANKPRANKPTVDATSAKVKKPLPSINPTSKPKDTPPKRRYRKLRQM